MRLETEEKDNKKRTKLRQATLRWPPEDRQTHRGRVEDHREEKKRDRSKEEKATWIQGGQEDDNMIYRDFLKYCGDKREKENWR